MADLPASKPPEPVADLCACPACGSPLAQLVDAEPLPAGGWEITLRCPECWATIEEQVDDATIELMDRSFDEAVRYMVEELRRLTSEHMREDVERFAAALRADAILPMDF